jgi:hypothetical protein
MVFGMGYGITLNPGHCLSSRLWSDRFEISSYFLTNQIPGSSMPLKLCFPPFPELMLNYCWTIRATKFSWFTEHKVKIKLTYIGRDFSCYRQTHLSKSVYTLRLPSAGRLASFYITFFSRGYLFHSILNILQVFLMRVHPAFCSIPFRGGARNLVRIPSEKLFPIGSKRSRTWPSRHGMAP